MYDEDEPAVYRAEQERFLQQARERGLLNATDARRLHAAYLASMGRAQLRSASILPRLLLEAEDGVVLDGLAHPERAGDRWALYERIRDQTAGRRAA